MDYFYTAEMFDEFAKTTPCGHKHQHVKEAFECAIKHQTGKNAYCQMEVKRVYTNVIPSKVIFHFRKTGDRWQVD